MAFGPEIAVIQGRDFAAKVHAPACPNILAWESNELVPAYNGVLKFRYRFIVK